MYMNNDFCYAQRSDEMRKHLFLFFCRYEYLFNFDNTFEIHDDIEVLKRMGLTLGLDNGSCSKDDIDKAVSMVPPSLEHYVRNIAQSSAEKKQQHQGTRYVTECYTRECSLDALTIT